MRHVTPLGSARESAQEGARRRAAHRQFATFLVAAGASVPVNLLARILLSQWLPYGVAILLAHCVGMLTAYTLTRQFVFEHSGRSIASELGRFSLVNLLSATITWAVSMSLVHFMFPALEYTHEPELTAHLLGLAAASLTSFVGHRRFSFEKSTRLG